MALLDQFGMPLSKKEVLKTEQITPQLTGVKIPFGETIAPFLTPGKMSRILREAANGQMDDFLTIAEEMEELETQYGSVLSTRKRAITSLEACVEAASDNPEDVKIADAVRNRIVAHSQFYSLITDMLDALGKGYSVTEIIWNFDKNEWYPKEFIWRDPRLFQFDREDKTTLRKKIQNSQDGEELEPFKFIKHFPKLKSGLPARNGLARLAMWSFLLKSYSMRDWAAFLELHGMPLRLGKYGTQSSEADRKVLLRAVRDLGSDAAAIIPQEMSIEFLQTKNLSERPFEAFAAYLDKSLSKAIIGQTMTADEGSSGGLAQAKVHETVRGDIKKADIQQLVGSLQSELVIPFINLNFGIREVYPIISFPLAEVEDIKVLASALKDLVPLGLKIQMSEVRDRLGFADPEEGAEILGNSNLAQDITQKASNRKNEFYCKSYDIEEEISCPCCGEKSTFDKSINSATSVIEDEKDALIVSALEDWEQDLSPIIEEILKTAQNSSDYEGFLKGLEKLIPLIPDESLAKKIAIQNMIARTLGENNLDKGKKA